MDWAQLLVIILAIFLALFLLLGIILVILLIRVTIAIKSVTETAQRTASGVEGIINNVGKFSSPGLVGKLALKQVKKIRNRRK